MRKPSLAKKYPTKYRNRTIEYDAVIDEVSDGDTITVVLLVPGYPTVALRLKDVRAPEKGELGYEETKRFTYNLLPHGMPVKVYNEDRWNYDRLEAELCTVLWVRLNPKIKEFVLTNGFPLGRMEE